jgi:hypothetical protein
MSVAIFGRETMVGTDAGGVSTALILRLLAAGLAVMAPNEAPFVCRVFQTAAAHGVKLTAVTIVGVSRVPPPVWPLSPRPQQ